MLQIFLTCTNFFTLLHSKVVRRAKIIVSISAFIIQSFFHLISSDLEALQTYFRFFFSFFNCILPSLKFLVARHFSLKHIKLHSEMYLHTCVCMWECVFSSDITSTILCNDKNYWNSTFHRKRETKPIKYNSRNF
jgi:hypothetical protein